VKVANDTKQVISSGKRMPPAAGRGRKPGSVNKTTAAVKETILVAFEGMGGLSALIEWGKANPTPFYQIYAKLLPKEIIGELEHKGEPIKIESKLDFSKLTIEQTRVLASIPLGD
jgi:hypothetical protein